MKIEVYIDGASRGNPGPSGIGIYIKDADGKEILKKGEYLGETTNNVAEYSALIEALEFLKDQKKTKSEISVKSDSELIIKQITGDYRIKSKLLMPLAIKVRKLIKEFQNIEFLIIDRKDNKVADKLANKSMNIMDNVTEANMGGDGPRTER
ncbi:MAG: ribonuclease HI family protein [Planctomycetes bacterium]|nr:ribonuclease HI family protein [Planctomycetota bacterium]